MRVDPNVYPLVFNKIIETGQAIYGNENCKPVSECTTNNLNCCPDMLARMEVGLVRYATTRTDLGIASNSSISMQSEVYFVEGSDEVRTDPQATGTNIANGVGSPFDNCVQLAAATDNYYKNNNLTEGLWKDNVNTFCDNCEEAGPGNCELCDKFPGDAKVEAPISCSGYDVFSPETAQTSDIVSLMKEVLNVEGQTHLYLIREGFQRFMQGLLFVNDTIPVAPIYGKQLTSLELESGEDVTELSTRQIESISPTPLDADEKPSPTTVNLGFADGSTIRAKSAYLTMLPYDLPQVQGFAPWNATIGTYMSPGQAVKLVLGWADAADAPPAMLNLTSCIEEKCNRLILDGPAEDDWTIRQFWLWDPKTIMVYDISPKTSGTNQRYAGTNLVDLAQEQGMDAMIQKVMKDLRNATKVDIPDPQWGRLKPWPEGNLLPGWLPTNPATNISGPTFATYIQRPLGADVPVYYGNSETSTNGANHGWAEGAAENVEDMLPSLLKQFGVTDYEKKGPDNLPRDQRGEFPGTAPGMAPSSGTSPEPAPAPGPPSAGFKASAAFAAVVGAAAGMINN